MLFHTMANKFRGTTWNMQNKIQIRRSIDLAELGDFGEIAETTSDLPTAGAVHRKATGGSTSGTRGYTDLQGLFDTVVDNQDMGLVADATTTHRIWSPSGAITDVVTEAPTGILASLSNTTALSDWSASTLAYTLDNPNPYGTSADDRFGFSVAIDGDYAIIGANLEDDAGGIDAGKAYIYNVTTGTLVHTLDGTSGGDYFGNSVAISGDRAIVGAWKEDDDFGSTSGKAYIYNVTTGALVHTLDNPSAFSTSTGDFFGYRVAISGDRAIIGAYGEGDAGGAMSGKAYIFNVTTGTLVHTINNPNAYGTSEYDFFGSQVAISGDYAIVGAYGEDDAGVTFAGKVYIYNVSTGALVHIINNPSAFGTSDRDFFGAKIAISGDYVIVGVYEEDDAGGDGSGKAYIFDVTTGTLVHTLDNPNAYGTSSNDQFGMGVAISGDYAIVTAVAEDEVTGYNSGKAYIYNVTSGALVKTLDNPNAYDTPINDAFGYSVAISGDNVIVGAYAEDDAGGSQSGKAYIFTAG